MQSLKSEFNKDTKKGSEASHKNPKSPKNRLIIYLIIKINNYFCVILVAKLFREVLEGGVPKIRPRFLKILFFSPVFNGIKRISGWKSEGKISFWGKKVKIWRLPGCGARGRGVAGVPPPPF